MSNTFLVILLERTSVAALTAAASMVEEMLANSHPIAVKVGSHHLGQSARAVLAELRKVYQKYGTSGPLSNSKIVETQAAIRAAIAKEILVEGVPTTYATLHTRAGYMAPNGQDLTMVTDFFSRDLEAFAKDPANYKGDNAIIGTIIGVLGFRQ